MLLLPFFAPLVLMLANTGCHGNRKSFTQHTSNVSQVQGPSEHLDRPGFLFRTDPGKLCDHQPAFLTDLWKLILWRKGGWQRGERDGPTIGNALTKEETKGGSLVSCSCHGHSAAEGEAGVVRSNGVSSRWQSDTTNWKAILGGAPFSGGTKWVILWRDRAKVLPKDNCQSTTHHLPHRCLKNNLSKTKMFVPQTRIQNKPVSHFLCLQL